ncbi:TetR/AcrR family transcriptional regulator [Pseudenhygromyxa sp. WMMC2535]|uniref:TetR/AcrR family transcriptional regulator n=1 Tax=Pseudenhygromyxa sp. WMMC2535 TaxID=2712867 RepID=UPI001595CE82|nr:TetR/AcrR family transcriptional regulator [Pseudenhygromyxa sp. WMMC2535]NVB40022.1 TetR/AcrR family transcriptional regulator [Pseudenhygromyxa sp. WMMC2535]
MTWRYHAGVAGSTKTPTARRRDAQENRERIIQAARKVFAASGYEAPLSAIASEAGVGRATLYRNFPDRSSLATAIFEDNIMFLETLAKEHSGEPGAFMVLLSAVVEQQLESHALFPSLLASENPDLRVLERRTRNLLRGPLRAAKAAGEVRSDLSPTDVLIMLAMLSVVVIGNDQSNMRQQRIKRAHELLLAGILPR